VSDSNKRIKQKHRLPSFLLDWSFELSALFLLAVWAGPSVYQWLDATDLPVRMSLLWVPVVVLALHYGLLSGLIASTIAFAIYATQHGADIAVGESLEGIALRIGLEPLLWTMAAAFMGGMRAMAQERVLNLDRELFEERQTVSVITERYARLRDRVEFLERSLTVGRDPHMRHAIRKADALGEMSAADCRDSLYEILSSAANGASITLFVCAEKARVRLPSGASSENDYRDIPPAAIFPVPDALGRTILEVHVEQIDPEHFTQVDQVYFFELCERIGAILDKRGTMDLFRLAVKSQAA
jgi:hypothetical protein